MATHYITSTADSGTGTLRQLISDAAEGDTIQPDPDLFPEGTVCKVTLASNLSVINKNLTFLGAQTRLEINGDGLYYFRFGRAGSVPLVFRDVDFVSLYASNSGASYGPVVFLSATYVEVTRCRAVGCSGVYSGGFKVYGSSAVAKFYDCAAYGNRCTRTTGQVAYAFWFNTANANNEMYRCTYGGCVTQTSDTAGAFKNTPSLIGDYVSPTYESEWKTPPSSTYSYSTWTKDSWQDMDPRPTSTSSFRTGSSNTDTTILDLDGWARKANGAKGAFEYSPKLATPTNLITAIVDATTVNVQWNAVKGATHYRVSIAGATYATVATPSAQLNNLATGTTYAISVVAIADGFDDSDAATTSATPVSGTKLEAPRFRGSEISASELWVEWYLLPTGAASILVTIYDGEVDDSKILDQQTFGDETNEYSYTPVVANKTYIVGLKHLPTSGYLESDETTATFVYAVSTPLAAPTVSTFVRPSDNSLKLSYLQVRLAAEIANATSYEYQIATNSSFTEGLLTRTSSTVTSGYPLSGYFTGLTSGTLYYARARALSSNSGYSTSEWSNVKSTRVSSYLATPTVAVSDITATSATLNWGEVANRSSYTVNWGASGVSSYATTGITSTSRTLTGLTPGTEYNYGVKAVGDGAEYLTSPTASGTFTTATTQTLATPTGLSATNVTDTTATLNWNAVTNASGYKVEWRASGASTWNEETVNA